MSSAATVQVNVRVNPEIKANAEDVLNAAGTSVASLVRDVLSKVAGGASDYAQVAKALAASDQPSAKTSLLEEGWSIADGFYQSYGTTPAAERTGDTRTWEQVRDEARDDYFGGKGLLS